MVDRDIKKNRSLSADSDLHSGYETFRSGDYKSALAFVEKKLQKLNSPLDKFNFNILLALIYSKTNRLQDSHRLSEALKTEMLTYNYLNSVPEVCEYFKGVLRELDEDKILKEVFDFKNKNVNLAKIDKAHQKQILKELTLNMELNDLYAKVNVFLKNENEPNLELLNLLKYEVVYILCFKLQKLSKFIGSAIFKEMNTKFEALRGQKGFLDIYIKFLIGLNDTENFLKLFEGGKQHEFTNAPVDDLLVNIYYNQKNQDEKLINFLIHSIRNNLDKCNFNNFSRLVAYAFSILVKESTEENEIAFFWDTEGVLDLGFVQADFEGFAFGAEKPLKETFLGLYSFLSFVKNNSEMKTKNFNSWKSSVLSLLMFLHFVRVNVGKFVVNRENIEKLLQEKVESLVAPLALELLECSVTRQSILMELSKYFVYLSAEKRNEILGKFAYDSGILENSNNLSNEDKEKIIFYQKLKKMFALQIGFPAPASLEANSSNCAIESISLSKELAQLDQYTGEIISLYFKVTKSSKKLEKGERILGDDLVILLTEAFFELTNKYDLNCFSASAENSENFAKIAYNVYATSFIAYERSPYNYDISLMFLRLCGYFGLNTKLFTILTTMNLKGPQFESVSYIAHKYFLNSQFKQGLTYLYGHLDKWQKDNKKCSRKTLWKMFTGRNFWDTEELIEFLSENENSYFKFVNEFHQISVEYINTLLLAAPESVKKQELLNCAETVKFLQKNLEAKMENSTLNKNQDVLISVFKYKYVPYFGDNLPALSQNANYNQKNFVFKFAIDKVNKDNLIFENTPGFKNNFFTQEDISVFGNFENEQFLNLNYLTSLLKVNLKFNFDANINAENKPQQQTAKAGQIELDQMSVKEALEKALLIISSESAEKISASQKICKSEFNFVFELEKLLVRLFKFEFECGSDVAKLESDFSQMADILAKLQDLTIKSADFASFKGNYKSFNHVHKTSLVNKLRIFARFYLPAFALLVAKINNFIGFNKTKFQNAAGLKSNLNSLFKSAFMNFLGNLETINNDSDEVNKIESFLNLKEFNDYNGLPAKIKTQIRKNVEENTREIKEIAKSLTAFIREML